MPNLENTPVKFQKSRKGIWDSIKSRSLNFGFHDFIHKFYFGKATKDTELAPTAEIMPLTEQISVLPTRTGQSPRPLPAEQKSDDILTEKLNTITTETETETESQYLQKETLEPIQTDSVGYPTTNSD
ncbi:MAG: hypothetical protein GY861_14240 [bacterium]|nr:hypothetical protein [bacterium]